MSAYWEMNRVDQYDADMLGYAIMDNTPEGVRGYGHTETADYQLYLWRHICGARAEKAGVRLFENVSKQKVEWFDEVLPHEEVKRRTRWPDVIYAGLPLQIKGSPDWRNFYVRDDQVYSEQFYVQVYLGNFPVCEFMGWLFGQRLFDDGERRNDGAPGRFFECTNPHVRDVMQLIWKPDFFRERWHRWLRQR